MLNLTVRQQREVATYDRASFVISLSGFLGREVYVHTPLDTEEWQSGTLLDVNEVNVVIGHGRGTSTLIPLELVSGVRLYPQS